MLPTNHVHAELLICLSACMNVCAGSSLFQNPFNALYSHCVVYTINWKDNNRQFRYWTTHATVKAVCISSTLQRYDYRMLLVTLGFEGNRKLSRYGYQS